MLALLATSAVVLGGIGACVEQIKRTPADMGQVQTRTQAIKLDEPEIALRADVEFPQVSGTNDAVAKRINSYMQEEAQQSIDVFRKQVEPIERESKPTDDRTSTLDARYEVTLLKAQLMSVRIDVSARLAGAAAAEDFVATYVFDLGTGRHLGLEELYGAKDFLALFSGRAQVDLTKKYGIDPLADEGRFNSGTEAKDKSFQAFVLTDTGVRVYFQPGQIASMSRGILTLDVPYDVLDPFVSKSLPPIVELHKAVDSE